jgi:F420-0:gamma-glutamyl ligase-like protein
MLLWVSFILAGYSLVAAVVYALCRYLDIGISVFDDGIPAKWLASFWPVGVWIILAVALAMKLGKYADALRVASEQKRELAEKQRMMEKLGVEKTLRQLERRK